ncbi:hypothetical protein Ais01nite_77630 [Asanoa ishikariensis]|uniref:Uncharacterized protein n=1 Tax=Asanoa ishikariensis TaxID=137265 RepID=A0A1H3KSC9_9ACTN|nr:hypothetical protein [Asanoa ishikariensis]GIF69728.1 hypothetical protein Ais01nite_77630 [Asanoa ishikariensis]SDY54916.1 hypothetical protein SAMN05421684_0306 [Asanoa ishikariensis]
MTSDRAQSRAEHPLPEEEAVGSDDFQDQSEAILMESDIREKEPEATRQAVQGGEDPEEIERRTSEEAAE